MGLIAPVHEHGRFSHFFIIVFYFLLQCFFILVVEIFHNLGIICSRVFKFFFVDIMNELNLKSFFSAIILSVHTKAVDSCVLKEKPGSTVERRPLLGDLGELCSLAVSLHNGQVERTWKTAGYSRFLYF